MDEILSLREIYPKTFFNEKELHVITSAFLIFGAFLNITVIFKCVNRLNEGITLNIITIAFLDILNLVCLLPEIIYVNNRNWKFSENLCTVYLGVECVINISIFYTTIVTNLQLISSLNGIIRYYESKNKEIYDDSFDDESEDDEGYEILGNDYVSSHKNTDFVQKPSFSVLFFLVTLLSISVSTPFFMYAQKTVIPGTETSICVMKGLNDEFFNYFIACLVIFVRILLPSVLLVVTTCVLFTKYLKGIVYHLGQPIKIELMLSFILILCSLQRIYASLFFEIYSSDIGSNNNKTFTQFKYPHIRNNLIAVLLTLTHYLSSLVRPFATLLMIHSNCRNKTQRKVTTVAIKAINKTMEV